MRSGLIIFCALLFCTGTTAAPRFDTVIRDVTLHDGTGAPARQGQIAILADRIAAVGNFAIPRGTRVVEGRGLVAAPGFIDLHTHSDIDESRSREATIADRPLNANSNYLTQGVTTVVTGNCGFGPVEVSKFLGRIGEIGAGTNVIHLIPHNDLREKVLGPGDRSPTPSEMERMRALVQRGMREGAWGMSTGLFYRPGSYATTGEIAALAGVVAAHGGIYASHLRDEGVALIASIEEAVEIGRRAGVPVHISHLKADRPRVWGTARPAIEAILEARATGVRVTADQYPYTACSTRLSDETIPSSLRGGGPADFHARADGAEWWKVRTAIRGELAEYRGGETIRIATFPLQPSWQGRSLASIARSRGIGAEELVLEIERGGDALTVNHSMSEGDLREFMRAPFVATASDGRTMAPGPDVPHPRNYGTFPRKIGRYAIEMGVVDLPTAIRSATGLPSDILGLSDRGYLRAGYFADIVVFDPRTLRDEATFETPHRYSTGVRHSFVNGVPAIVDGRLTGVLAGRALRGPGTAGKRPLWGARRARHRG